uniref:Transmembrane protein n=1 Tax=Panagrellus redivivus TaxID=6233 RepID=A0A7E4WCJ2_PANRE
MAAPTDEELSSWSTINLDSNVSSDSDESFSVVAARNFEDVEAGRQAAGFEEPLSAAAFARGRGVKKTKSGHHDGRLSGSREVISNSKPSSKKSKKKKSKKSAKKRFWNKGAKTKSKKSKKKRKSSKSKKPKKSRKERVKTFFQPKLRPQSFVEANWPLLDVFVLIQLFIVFAFIANAALFAALQIDGAIACITFAVVLGVSALPPFFLIARGEVESAISVYATVQLTAGFFGFMFLIRHFLLVPWLLDESLKEYSFVYDVLWFIVVWQFVSTLFATWTPYKPVNSRVLRLLSSQSGVEVAVRSRSSKSSKKSRSSKKSKSKSKKKRRKKKRTSSGTVTKASVRADSPRPPPLNFGSAKPAGFSPEPPTVPKMPESSRIDASSKEPVPGNKPLQPVVPQPAGPAKSGTSVTSSDMTIYRKKF